VTVEMKQIEGEIGETVAPSLRDVVLEIADVCRALLVRAGQPVEAARARSSTCYGWAMPSPKAYSS
jgi:hypothetical protein